jgi:hypothetical protein
MKTNSWRRELEKRSRRGKPDEFPIGTLLFYGPDNRFASKVVAAVFARDGAEPELRKWFSDGMDVRLDPRIGREVIGFFREHGARRVGSTPGLAGCPHEEGIDYPSGEPCPQCPFWADRDRWEEAVKPPLPPGYMAN